MKFFFDLIQNNFNSLFIMGVRVATMVAKFGLAIFVARYMGFESLGLYGLLAITVVFVPVFSRLGILNILIRDAVTQTPSEFVRALAHYYGGLGVLYLVALICFTIYCVVTGLWVVPLLLFVLIVFENIVCDWFFFFLSLNKSIRGNILLSIQSGGWMIAFMGFAWWIPSMQTIPVLLMFWVGGGVLAVFSILWFCRTLPWRDAFSQKLSFDWYKQNWQKSRLFYVGDIANASGQNIDRYLVGILFGLELTGVYVLFWQMANALFTLVWSGVGQLYRPKLIKAAAENKDAVLDIMILNLKDVSKSMVLIGTMVGIIGYFVTPLTDSPLAQSYIILLWLLLVAVCIRLISEVLNQTLYAFHQDRVVVASTIILLALSGLLVPVFGMVFGFYGVAFALISVNICVLVYRKNILKSYLKT